jgi:type I restriction enzyme R subunit
VRLCHKKRFLEIIHDFIVFDAGTKKTCRHNQYFGTKAAQQRVQRREGGIIWHTQGSGKSLTMVWLAKWIREHATDARILIITDRTELDEQIEGVFQGVDEAIYRTTSGADLIAKLNATTPGCCAPWSTNSAAATKPMPTRAPSNSFADLQRNLPSNFSAKGNLFVFVDECHRTQSGKLHKAMKALLPEAHVHRLHRHPVAQRRQTNQHGGLRQLHPHLQIRRSRQRWGRPRPALRSPRHRPAADHPPRR